MDFNKLEQTIISYWKENKIFEKICESKKNLPKWEFLDGPPFVNGTPHMGHMLVSSIKDTMARYMMQKGHSISYTIGFDCHGLPLEQEAEKICGKVSPNDSTMKLKLFNDTCRQIISNCSNDWFEKLGRLGRMFNNTYYTSNFDYMKSLWWAFKELYKKGLIYRSKKVMPYSPLCETPLSNFEASSNYIERTDISVYVKFRIKDTDEYLLAWTTTPWSLFANQGIGINKEFYYDLIEDNNNKYWVEKNCAAILFPNHPIIKSVLGNLLVGLEYDPIFKLANYNKYMVYSADYITSSSGTGIVHLAPMFGAEDMKTMKENGYMDHMIPEYLVNSMVQFNINYIVNDNDIIGKFVMDISTDITIHLKKLNIIYKSEKIKHSYPHCWRTDAPLIYLATDAWFMDIQKIKPELIENNKSIQWSPSYVGTERFANWIKDSPDWCLSRNRVWGTPIPIWTSDCGDMECLNVEDLEELTGKTFNDIHLDTLDNVTFMKSGVVYRRTFGVLDCWFESGMAGLSQYGYPACIDKSYPVDFIAESIDQTRGWFYTLNVLSTALCNQPAFKKVNVSGLILASDGKKMSKRLQNYTSPDVILSTYGADILRLYLIGCPAAKAESFCFKDSDLQEISKKMNPYYHAHTFLEECIIRSNDTSYLNTYDTTNKLDLWIKNKFMEFANLVYMNMDKLEITYIPNLIYRFIDNLCNVYIKLSRDRMKSEKYMESLSTLYWVLKQMNLLLAPFTPHLAEYFNKRLHDMNNNNNYKSIHMETINNTTYNLDTKLLNNFHSINELLETVRSIRQQINRPIFYPLLCVEVYSDNDISEYKSVICSELNIIELKINNCDNISKKYKANRPLLGKVYKKDAAKYIEMIERGDITTIDSSFYTFEYIQETKENMISSVYTYHMNNMTYQALLYVDISTNNMMDMEAEINNIRRQVNNTKKDMNLKIYNKVDIYFEENELFSKMSKEQFDMLSNRLSSPLYLKAKLENYNTIETFAGNKINFHIKMQMQNQDINL